MGNSFLDECNGSVVNDVRTLLFGSMQDVPTSVEDNGYAVYYKTPMYFAFDNVEVEF